MSYEIASPLHIVSAFTALFSGALVFFLFKGTRLHKLLGYVYVTSMATLNFSAFFIYRLTGQFGPFHGAALASFLTLTVGFIPALRRKPHGQWLDLHYYCMCWSYAGLLAAGASEALTRIPESPFWPAVLAASLLVFFVSGALIFRRTPKDLLRHGFLRVESESANPR